MEIKKRVEALLFSSGKRMNVEEIARICNSKAEEVKKALAELKKEYDEKDTSLVLIQDDDFWKLTVHEQYFPIVQKVVTETELSKTILETLAVIAFKYPILQSDLIKIRTNKAYDHLLGLEESGYITRQKHGRTKLIKLTERFFEYFDLPQDKLREQFKDFGSIAKAIEEKEMEIEKAREEQKKTAEEAKKEDERMRQAAENVDEIELETYNSEESRKEIEQQENQETFTEKDIGNLEVVEEASEEELEKERERIRKIQEEGTEKTEAKKQEIKQKKPKKEEKKSQGIKLTKDMEKEVDKRVEEILHPEEEDEESGIGEIKPEIRENQSKGKAPEDEEPKDLLEAEMEEEKEREEEK